MECCSEGPTLMEGVCPPAVGRSHTLLPPQGLPHPAHGLLQGPGCRQRRHRVVVGAETLAGS